MNYIEMIQLLHLWYKTDKEKGNNIDFIKACNPEGNLCTIELLLTVRPVLSRNVFIAWSCSWGWLRSRRTCSKQLALVWSVFRVQMASYGTSKDRHLHIIFHVSGLSASAHFPKERPHEVCSGNHGSQNDDKLTEKCRLQVQACQVRHLFYQHKWENRQTATKMSKAHFGATALTHESRIFITSFHFKLHSRFKFAVKTKIQHL